MIAVVTPAFADTPVHLDLIASGTMQNSTFLQNAQKVGSVDAHLSLDLNKHLTVFSDLAGAGVSQNPTALNPRASYDAVVYDGGVTLNFSRATHLTTSFGTAITTQVVLPGQPVTATQLGLSLSTRVF